MHGSDASRPLAARRDGSAKKPIRAFSVRQPMDLTTSPGPQAWLHVAVLRPIAGTRACRRTCGACHSRTQKIELPQDQCRSCLVDNPCRGPLAWRGSRRRSKVSPGRRFPPSATLSSKGKDGLNDRKALRARHLIKFLRRGTLVPAPPDLRLRARRTERRPAPARARPPGEPGTAARKPNEPEKPAGFSELAFQAWRNAPP